MTAATDHRFGGAYAGRDVGQLIIGSSASGESRVFIYF